MAIFNSFLYVYQRVFVLGINHKSPDPGRGDRGSLHRDWGFFLPPEIDPNNSRPARIGKPYGIAGVRTSTIFLMIFLLNRKNIIQKQSGKKGQALSLEQIKMIEKEWKRTQLGDFSSTAHSESSPHESRIRCFAATGLLTDAEKWVSLETMGGNIIEVSSCDCSIFFGVRI